MSLPLGLLIVADNVSLSDSNLWHNFFHRSLFFKEFFSKSLAPHIVFAILAHTTFLQAGKTRTGQVRALQFAEEARKMLDHCLESGPKEPNLAQTALLLVAFEFQPHIHQNIARATAALSYMETCAQACLNSWPRHLKMPLGQVVNDSQNARSTSITAIRQEELRRMSWTLSQLATSSTIWRLLGDKSVINLASADPTRVSCHSLFTTDTQFNRLLPLDKGSQHDDPSDHTSWLLYYRAVCLW